MTISPSMDPCVFCDTKKLEREIIYESKNFYVIPTIGQISDGGHVLIVSKDHLPALGAMNRKHLNEFSELKFKVQEAIHEEYEKTIVFEHGIVGQSVPHAHLQILPSSTDLLSTLHKKYPFYKKLDSIDELCDTYEKRRLYLFYENQQNEKFCFYMDAIPQYLRLVAAEKMGRTPRGDWKQWRADPQCATIDDQLMTETTKKLSKFFKD